MEEAGFNRDRIVKETKIGKYKCIVNVNILSVGYDNPRIDLIGILRPTNSPVLHVQALGRGSRAHPEKVSCLVLDFAGNTSRLGPINDPFIKMKGKGKEGGDPIMKDCPDCDSIVAPAVKICPDCGHKFKFRHGLYGNAITNDVIDDCKPHLVCVDDIFYDINTKVGSPNSVQVTYKCGALKVKEWICIEHRGFAKHKADHWVKFRGGIPCDTASELINISDTLRKPEEILIQRKGKYTTIKDAIFSP
jgi:DNA repair protein RadD